MHELLIHEGIQYELLDENNLEDAIDCVSDVFTQNEPLVHHLHIGKKEFLTFANAYYPKIAREGLSVVARDLSSDAVVGIRISEDLVPAEEVDLSGVTPQLFPVFAILDELGDHYRLIRDIVPGKFVHLFMVGVRDSHTCRGIAPTMNRLFFKHVIEKGYEWAVTEPTGAISLHVLKDKFGFRQLHAIPYADFRFEGEPVFADIEGHKAAYLLEKKLSELKL